MAKRALEVKGAVRGARWLCASALVAGCGGGQTGDELAGDTVTQELAGTAQRLAAVGPENGGASRDNGDFAWRLLALESTPANNAVMSPYSISVAAAMLSAGAGGQTLSEIREAMSFSAEGDAFHAAHNRLLQTLDSRNHPATEDTNAQTLRLSNDLWLLPELRPSDAFLNVLSSQYGASVQLTQFDTHPEEARQAINAKVAEDTEQLIDELLPARSIDAAVAFVLTNAIYFKARWANGFQPSATAPAPFETNAGATVDVAMMRSNGSYASYRATDDYVAASLPYFGGELELVAIMPTAGTFEAFVSGLDAPTVDAIAAGLEGAYLDLRFPKFEIETSLPLVQHLKSLGMINAFEASADFDAIAEGVFIGSAYHDAVIILDEEGTEAAAATAFVGTVVSAPPPPVPVTFDRPFIFYIRDTASNATLFVGQFVTP